MTHLLLSLLLQLMGILLPLLQKLLLVLFKLQGLQFWTVSLVRAWMLPIIQGAAQRQT